jgi:MEDS: MEthanogen/methylotroph, DcmR Sensory domain
MNNTKWNRASADIFWGEIAPTDHVVQVYENDEIFLDTLAGFVGSGINAGDCVIVIATPIHLQLLYERLSSYAINVSTLVDDDRYIALDAEATLSKFMKQGWPDELLFNETISSIIQRGVSKGRRIKAFGEMVALLWANGHNGATVHLEHLWTKFCKKNKLSLFCAYPRAGFTEDINESINTICNCHNTVINGIEPHLTEVLYSGTLGKVV